MEPGLEVSGAAKAKGLPVVSCDKLPCVVKGCLHRRISKVHPSVPSMAERQEMSIMLSRVGPGTERGMRQCWVLPPKMTWL
jgi:hypothetical protein